MTSLPPDMTLAAPTDLPRAQGALRLSTKAVGNRSALDRLRPSGCMKALFPNRQDHVEAIVINSSGGLTAGDQLQIDATVGENSHLTLTTQAAERAYRAVDGVARVETHLNVATGATLHWLPQELILFNGAALHRSLHIDMAQESNLLLVEPIVFGRTAMGEHVTDGDFRDQISVWRAGRPLYLDMLRLTGNIGSTLAKIAVADGGAAMASVLYVAPDAERHLAQILDALPKTAGASLLHSDVLVMRFVAADSHLLRQDLLPVLDRLSRNSLPLSWRL